MMNTPSPIPKPTMDSASKPTATVSISNENGELKKAWTVAVAWISFILIATMCLVSGPGMITFAASLGTFGWVAGMMIVPLFTFAVPIMILLLLLDLVILIITYKKFPRRIRTVTTLIGGTLLSYAAYFLCYCGFVPLETWMAVAILTIVPTIPIVLLIIFKVRDSRGITKPEDPKRRKVLKIVLIVAIVAEMILSGIMPASPLITSIQEQQSDKEYQKTVSDVAEQSGAQSSEKLSELVYVLCSCGNIDIGGSQPGDYEVLYQSNEDEGIFLCKESQEVYSVTDTHSKSSEEYPIRRESDGAINLGSVYSESVANIFGDDEYYILRQYGYANMATDLIILTEANSEDEVVEAYADKIYDYCLTGSDYGNDPVVTIYYNEKLNTIKSVKDYIVLSGATSVTPFSDKEKSDFLPAPLGRTRTISTPRDDVMVIYTFESDGAPSLTEMDNDPQSYASDVRNAIESNRHISTEIPCEKAKNGQFTANEIRGLLEDGWVTLKNRKG